MFNSGFYPTPHDVVNKMLLPYSERDLLKSTILEPSAGKGDICDVIMSRTESYRRDWRNEGTPIRLHCCEIEPELRATLMGKGYPVVAHDFLTFQPDENYDFIIMNPPFSHCEKHIMKAWDIVAQGGNVVSLLPSEVLQNPKNSIEQHIVKLVEQHGRSSRLGACFTDAFRKTSVDVSMIHLGKPVEEVKFTLFDGLQTDADIDFDDGTDFSSQVATRNVVGNLVMAYNRVVKLYKGMAEHSGEMEFFTQMIAPGGYYGEDKKQVVSIPHYNDFIRNLKRKAWFKIMNMPNFRNLMSGKVLEDFNKQREVFAQVAFTEDNILSFLDMLWGNRGNILNQCVLEAFDLMTSFDAKNKVHVEGWKTNDAWRVNKKVIVPVIGRYPSNFDIDAWVQRGGCVHYKIGPQIDDVDRGLAYLVGQKLESIVSIRQGIKAQVNATPPGHCWLDGEFESEFFRIRAYKKGTLHLVFKDADLWERFNIVAAEGKNWLPDDYKYREKAAKKGAMVPV